MTNNKGLRAFVGSEYNIRVAKSSNSKEFIDFTQKGNTKLIFPTSFTVKKNVEVIDQSRIGLPTNIKILGKSQITGDMGDIITPNGIAFYTAMSLGGVTKSLENNKAFISIEYDGNFIVDITKDINGKTTQIDIVLDENTKRTIAISENMTITSFLDLINSFKTPSNENEFLAIMHIGDGSEILNFEEGENDAIMSINSSIREFFRVGDLSEEYKTTIAPYINFIIPKRGSPEYFNILVSSRNAILNTQYGGCRMLTLNMSYQNNNLTNITTNIWAGYDKDFDGEPSQAEVDDVSTAYSQTNGRTKVFYSGKMAMALSTVTNNFEWIIEPNWNISNDPYEVPISKYTDSYDIEAIFNEETKEIFQDRVNNNKNISLMIETSTMKNAKEYKIIKSTKTLLGQPQYPSIADGVISLQASGFTSKASVYDPYTTLMIITSDINIGVNYTKEEIVKDFSGYTNI